MAAHPPVARKVGKYRLYSEIGCGGMGSVHLGRLFASGGFRRLVAIKRLHPHLARDEHFLAAFLDEAQLASRIHHPNVIAPLDVVATGGEVLLVLEYVPGLSLAALTELARDQGEPVPRPIAVRVLVDVLGGLQAAHEATGDDGTPLALVHRDVSPQNILVGKDGSARLLDFGIAKARGRSQITDEGTIKGKRGYMAPEHLLGRVTPASDIYASAVVLFEVLTGARLFPDEQALPERIGGERVRWPDGTAVPPSLQRTVLTALAADPADRFATARDFSVALEAEPMATSREIGEWLARLAEAPLRARAELVATIEATLDAPMDPAEPGAVPPEVAAAASDTTLVTANTLAEPPASSRTVPAVLLDPGANPPLRSRVRNAALGLTALAALLLLALVRVAPAPPVATAQALPQVVAAELVSRQAAPAAAAPSDVAAPSSSALEPAAAVVPAKPAKGSHPPPTQAAARGQTRPKGAAACKPYVLDAQGRTRFDEACLRRSGSSGR